jgi:hypothetical protein
MSNKIWPKYNVTAVGGDTICYYEDRDHGRIYFVTQDDGDRTERELFGSDHVRAANNISSGVWTAAPDVNAPRPSCDDRVVEGNVVPRCYEQCSATAEEQMLREVRGNVKPFYKIISVHADLCLADTFDTEMEALRFIRRNRVFFIGGAYILKATAHSTSYSYTHLCCP